jgi:hypothetical protein
LYAGGPEKHHYILFVKSLKAKNQYAGVDSKIIFLQNFVKKVDLY